MAEKMTRKQALEFAIDGVEYARNLWETDGDWSPEQSDEVIAILKKMLESISKPRAKQVSKARLSNEHTAKALWEISPETITTKAATEMGIPEIMTTQKAAAVLRVGVELGLFEKLTEGKKVAYRKIG